jgi:hypothetical protein
MIMNTLIKKLPLLAFVLAAFAALAFTSPVDTDPEYGFDGTDWQNVAELTIGVDYDCNLEPGQVCTRTAPSPAAPMVKPGIIEFLNK